jgi:uncharacterized lipoprotein YddW (UPF0748 family)
MVQRAEEAGFNTLIVQVRGRGDAYYDSRWEPRADTLESQASDYDPLALVIEEARARGLAVHAWVNTYLTANMDVLPRSADHLYHTRPDLLAVPRPVARQLYDMDPGDPRYRDAIVEYARSNRNTTEGVYLSPSAPEVKEHLYSIWMDILERYDVDGIHYDYVRYANPDFDYSRPTLERFRDWLVPQLGETEVARFAEREDPLVYADSFPDAWDRFRRDEVTDLVERIYHGVKEREARVLVSGAVIGNAEDGYLNRYQDWRAWLRQGILDVAAPMAYSQDTETFRSQIRTAVETAGGERVWAGIGSWRIPVESTVEKIEAARLLNAAGIVLFSYDRAVRVDEYNPAGDYLQRVRDLAFEPPVAASASPD